MEALSNWYAIRKRGKKNLGKKDLDKLEEFSLKKLLEVVVEQVYVTSLEEFILRLFNVISNKKRGGNSFLDKNKQCCLGGAFSDELYDHLDTAAKNKRKKEKHKTEKVKENQTLTEK